MKRPDIRNRSLTTLVITALSLVALAVLLASCSQLRDFARAERNKPQAGTHVASSLPDATIPPLEPTYAAMLAERRNPDVPQLPFPDNPDPSQCGIPTPWGANSQAWLNGIYEGEVVQPVVLLYDSHLRLDIRAQAAHGSEVEVLLYQQNPVTDYYLVKLKGAEPPSEGWVPGPFLSFEPVSPLS